MAAPFIVIQLVVSLVLVLGVAWLVRFMGLGADVRLRSEVQVRDLARSALCGFEPTDMVLDRAGIGALARDAQGRVMLLKRHGAQFAARLLDSHAFTRLDRNFLTIGSGERNFTPVTLDLGEQAQVWAASLRRLER